MVGMKCVGSVLVLATLGLSSASAFGWSRSSTVARCYYYPAPIVAYSGWAYAYPVVPSYSVPLAVPTPAPPSTSTAEPPLLRRVEMPPADKPLKPNVVEARKTATPRCKVGFWNLAGRDVVLNIDGKSQIVPRNRSVTLELARDFVWRVDEQPAKTERIADDKATHDIVIR
jgi:hypothetical protein